MPWLRPFFTSPTSTAQSPSASPSQPAGDSSLASAQHLAPVDNGRPAARLRDVLFRPASQKVINQRNVLVDAVGVGITAGVGSFLSVFLVRLGASNFMIGLLTAMPALTGMLLAMPIGEFLARRPHIVPWFARSRFLVLSCYVLTGLVPFFVAQQNQPEVIILIWALATLPQTVVSVAFTVVMGQVAGPGGRLTLMSRRWSILGLTNALTVAIVGQILPMFQFPINYQIVFIGSAIGALISVVFSSSIRLPPVATPTAGQSLVGALRHHGHTLRANRQFLNFTVSQLVLRTGMALAIPLFPIYWVRVLNASDRSISAINSIQTIVAMLGYFAWTRVSQRRGERFVLLATTFGISFYPLLTALTNRVEVLVIWAALAGFFSAGIDLVFFDIVLSTCPAEQQPAYVGMYQTTVFMAAFLAPLVGTALSNVVGLTPVLVLSTAVRLAGFGCMALLGVAKIRR
jgi:hypothetical protein